MSDIRPEFRSGIAYCSEKCPNCILQVERIQFFQCAAGRLRTPITRQVSLCAPWYKAKLEAWRKWWINLSGTIVGNQKWQAPEKW